MKFTNTVLCLLFGMIRAADLPDFNYLGGMGPYISHDNMGVGPYTPDGCAVDQVVLLTRHGERYAVEFEYNKFVHTLEKLQNADKLTGPLEFISNYQLFMDKNDAEMETRTGPYNGHYDAEQLGKQFRRKYNHLVPNDHHRKLNIFTGDQPRVADTAEHFTKGFFGNEWEEYANVIEISEDGKDPVNSLTPGNGCTYDNSTGDYTDQTVIFRNKAFPPIVDRLKEYTSADLNVTDAFTLMNICPYEINALGKSAGFCSIFTEDEWKTFNYHQSLDNYYHSGGGQTGGAVAAGSVYTNASLALLKEGPEKMGGLYFNFAHDGDIVQTLTALNLFVPKENLPYDRRDDDSIFQVSQIIPMLSHITIERVSCEGDKSPYIRVNLNDAYIPLEGCQSGPGKSCPLDEYEEYVMKYYQNYNTHCKAGESRSLNFWWDHANEIPK